MIASDPFLKFTFRILCLYDFLSNFDTIKLAAFNRKKKCEHVIFISKVQIIFKYKMATHNQNQGNENHGKDSQYERLLPVQMIETLSDD